MGVASLALSPVTDAYFCDVTVAPDYRRRGIGTRLYGAVHALVDRSFPVLARAMSSQPIRRQFADHIGCSVLIHCPEPWVDPTSAAGAEWIAEQQLPAGYVTQSMGSLPLDQVQHAWAAYFDWTHQPFGPVHTDRLPQMWGPYSDGLDPDSSKLGVDRSTGKIVALSLVTPDAWDGRTMVVSETVLSDQSEGSPHLVRSLPPGGGDPMDLLKLRDPADTSVSQPAN